MDYSKLDDGNTHSCAGFCTLCGQDVESFEGLEGCPHCGTTGTPCSYDQQYEVVVNRHELRVLCIWAENWANYCERDPKTDEQTKKGQMKDVVASIANRLRRQLPDGTSLTMNDEFRELRKVFPGVETNHPAADDPELGDMYRGDGTL